MLIIMLKFIARYIIGNDIHWICAVCETMSKKCPKRGFEWKTGAFTCALYGGGTEMGIYKTTTVSCRLGLAEW